MSAEAASFGGPRCWRALMPRVNNHRVEVAPDSATVCVCRGELVGRVYGDGSAFEGDDVQLTVAGWALVGYSDGPLDEPPGQPVATWFGQLPGPVQDVDGAELFAFLQFLVRAVPGRAVYCTDSAFVHDGIAVRGKAATTSHRAAWAAVWRKVWVAAGRWPDNARAAITKISSHTSKQDVRDGKICVRDRAGNEAADYYAKEAACKRRAPPGVRTAVGAANALAEDAARWLAAIGPSSFDDVETAVQRRAAVPGPAPRLARPPRLCDSHVEGVTQAGVPYCKVCGCWRTSFARRCRGPPFTRAVGDGQGQGSQREGGGHLLVELRPDAPAVAQRPVLHTVCLVCGG